MASIQNHSFIASVGFKETLLSYPNPLPLKRNHFDTYHLSSFRTTHWYIINK